MPTIDELARVRLPLDGTERVPVMQSDPGNRAVTRQMLLSDLVVYVGGGGAPAGLLTAWAAVNGAGGLVQLDNTGKLPALDGSHLTNVPGAPSGLLSAWSAVNTATGLVQLDSSGKLPAVDGSQLTGVSGAPSGLLSAWGAVNAANGLVQLDSGGNLPAVGGAALTSVPSPLDQVATAWGNRGSPFGIIQADGNGFVPGNLYNFQPGLSGGGGAGGIPVTDNSGTVIGVIPVNPP